MPLHASRRARALVAWSFALLCALASSASLAQAYPSRPVRLVVPFAAGGTTDVLARILGQKLSESLGQQVLVDNRPGANGNIGAELVARSPGDGYTIMMGFDGTLAINPSVYRKLAFDPLRDFAPVANVGLVALMIVVHPSLPARSVAELVAHAKANPGKINYSSAGHGSTGHLAGELFKSRAGIDMTHVAYKGGAQAMNDLLSGQIQLLVTALPTVDAHVRSGKLRAIAFTTARRVPGMPEVPTLAESGYAGFDVASWYGIVAPSGTPAEAIRRLNAEIGKVLEQPDVRQRFTQLGTEPGGGTPESFGATLRADIDRWAAVVRNAGIHLD